MSAGGLTSNDEHNGQSGLPAQVGGPALVRPSILLPDSWNVQASIGLYPVLPAIAKNTHVQLNRVTAMLLYVSMHACTRIHTYYHVHTHTYTHTHTGMYTHTHTHTHTHTCGCTHTQACIHMNICMYMSTKTHTCTCTNTHTQTHKYRCTHTHEQKYYQL